MQSGSLFVQPKLPSEKCLLLLEYGTASPVRVGGWSLYGKNSVKMTGRDRRWNDR